MASGVLLSIDENEDESSGADFVAWLVDEAGLRVQLSKLETFLCFSGRDTIAGCWWDCDFEAVSLDG